jgi:hypothetical protein
MDGLITELVRISDPHCIFVKKFLILETIFLQAYHPQTSNSTLVLRTRNWKEKASDRR